MSDLAARVVAGEVRAAARACRLVDDAAPGHVDLLKALFPHTGRAWIVGVTGNPGAGKSTLVDRLIAALRAQGKKVAVVAVDPTSPFTGGAILGDRIRMQRHFEDPGVFIRSLATRGALGGLSRSARDVVRVLDAWGADVVLVETVGVGQDELEITRTAHTTLVVMAPGMGDDVQAIKAGILECADVFAVNKADREGADSTVREGSADHPEQALFASEGLQALVGAMEGTPAASRAVPAWRWQAGVHPVLGPIAPGVLVQEMTVAASTSPQVLIATPGALGRAEVLESGRLEVAGASVSSAQLVVAPRPQPACAAGPTAYEAQRFAGADVTLLLLDATGLGDTPLRLDAPQLLAGLSRAGEVRFAAALLPSRGARGCDAAGFADSPLAGVLARGGWMADGGEPVVAALAAAAPEPAGAAGGAALQR